jgi:hypothetical protein
MNDCEANELLKMLDPKEVLDLSDYCALMDGGDSPSPRFRPASPAIIDQIFAAKRAEEAEVAQKKAKLAHRRELDRVRRARARDHPKLTKPAKPNRAKLAQVTKRFKKDDAEMAAIKIAIANADAREQFERAKYAREGRVQLRDVLKNSAY